MNTKIFVQGATKPYDQQERALTWLGNLLKEKRCICLVGDKGKIPDILRATGVRCQRHALGLDGDKKEATGTIYYQKVAKEIIENHHLAGGEKEIAWGLRLGDWIGESKGFVFLYGSAGTLAHLFPVLTFGKKTWSQKGYPRKVVLLGWPKHKVYAIKLLYGFDKTTYWFKSFDLDQVDKAVDFLITY